MESKAAVRIDEGCVGRSLKHADENAQGLVAKEGELIYEDL